MNNNYYKKAKMSKLFKIGSSVFFNGINGYTPKDNDIMAIQDQWLPRNHHVLNLKKDGNDIFLWSPLTKEEFIKDTLECGVPMRVGKFLVPEFCDYIGFTIEELPIFDSIFNSIDDKHKYEKYIYEFYIKNGKFELTNEQRKKCYEIYKKYRE